MHLSHHSLKTQYPYILLIIGTCIIAIWTRWQNPVINPDGVKYLMVAEAFLRGDYAMAIDAYKWPFYSFSIAVFSKIFFLNTEHTALVMNAVMRGMIGLGFIRLCYLFGGNSKQLLLASIVITIYPGLNEIQAMVLRDFAYLTCWTWMMVFFLHHQLEPRVRRFAGFLLCGILAAAYRIEGLLFLILLSGLNLSHQSNSEKMRALTKILLILILPLSFCGLILWTYGGRLVGSQRRNRDDF